MRKLSISDDPFEVEVGSQSMSLWYRCRHAKIPLGYAILVLVILALAAAVIGLAVRPNWAVQTEVAEGGLAHRALDAEDAG